MRYSLLKPLNPAQPAGEQVQVAEIDATDDAAAWSEATAQNAQSVERHDETCRVTVPRPVVEA